MNKPFNRLWWFWIPLCFLGVQIVLEFILPSSILGKIHSENGPHEMLEFLVAGAAFLMAARMLLLPQLVGKSWLKAWIALAAVCCFYVAGEEISWGQQFLHWATPEYWTHVNDQHETNLHNTSTWLDQKPRMLLEIGVAIGGLIIPFLLHYRPAWVSARFAVIYPPAILSVTAALALGIKIAHKIDQAAPHLYLFSRANEVEELFLYYFVLLYLVVLKNRVYNF